MIVQYFELWLLFQPQLKHNFPNLTLAGAPGGGGGMANCLSTRLLDFFLFNSKYSSYSPGFQNGRLAFAADGGGSALAAKANPSSSGFRS